MARAYHYLGYAEDVYQGSLEKMGTVMAADVLLSMAESDEVRVKLPAHIVFVDHLTRSVVVAVRGTASLSDALTDMVCNEVPFLGGTAHAAMLEAARDLQARVEPVIRGALAQFPGYGVVCTGHSLGAGTATLLGLLLEHESKVLRVTGRRPEDSGAFFAGGDGRSATVADSASQVAESVGGMFGRMFTEVAGSSGGGDDRVACALVTYAFAPPPVFRPKAGTHLRRGFPNVVSFVHNVDVIPRVTLKAIFEMATALISIDKLGLDLSKIGAMAMTKRMEDGEVDAVTTALAQRARLPESKKDTISELRIVGSIWLLRPVEDGGGDGDESAGGGKDANSLFAKVAYTVEPLKYENLSVEPLYAGDSFIEDHGTTPYLTGFRNAMRFAPSGGALAAATY